MPNPWDRGSAVMLESLGFEALATTSSGFAATLGRLDGGVTRDEAIEHARAVAEAVSVPVSADLENCFADDPDGVAETVRLAAEAGLAGCSVEDYSGPGSDTIYDAGPAAERVRAAAEAAHAAPGGFVLTARAENHIHDRDDLADTIARLQSYQEAGADVLFAPGLRELSDIREVIGAVDLPVERTGAPRNAERERAGGGRREPNLGGRSIRLRRPGSRRRSSPRAARRRNLRLLGDSREGGQSGPRGL